MKLISQYLFVCFYFASFLTCFGDELIDIRSIMNNIPEEDRVDFLKYHLSIGYNLSKCANCGVTDATTKLSLQIYNYVKENYKTTEEGILKLPREIICFDDGTCHDIGDVGVHPVK